MRGASGVHFDFNRAEVAVLFKAIGKKYVEPTIWYQHIML